MAPDSRITALETEREGLKVFIGMRDKLAAAYDTSRERIVKIKEREVKDLQRINYDFLQATDPAYSNSRAGGVVDTMGSIEEMSRKTAELGRRLGEAVPKDAWQIMAEDRVAVNERADQLILDASEKHFEAMVELSKRTAWSYGIQLFRSFFRWHEG